MNSLQILPFWNRFWNKVLMFVLFFPQFLFRLLHAESPLHAKSTLVRTEESARWSHTQPRSNAPVPRALPGRSVSTVCSNHHPSNEFNHFLLCDQKSFHCSFQMVHDSLAAAADRRWLNCGFHYDPRSSSLSIGWQPKKPETNHPVFKTLLSAIITVIMSEDVQMSWFKFKRFQLR